jgi:hypothetical protein
MDVNNADSEDTTGLPRIYGIPYLPDPRHADTSDMNTPETPPSAPARPVVEPARRRGEESVDGDVKAAKVDVNDAKWRMIRRRNFDEMSQADLKSFMSDCEQWRSQALQCTSKSQVRCVSLSLSLLNSLELPLASHQLQFSLF